MPESVDDANLPRLIEELLGQHSKIEVIKIVRERTGLGLAEAKQVVEAVERNEPIYSGGQPVESIGRETETELVELLRSGKKVQAIKIYRQQTGLGLRDSKIAIERLAEQHGLEVGKSGCAAVVAVLVSLTLAGLWQVWVA